MSFLGPHEIIAAGKWKHALFTTYALSLTFFETHILKEGLLKTGCHSIWLVADLDGYQQSLAERQSSRVGQEYNLVPVALPHGVFHPKCTYLSGPEGDLLMIGSGNLTFGGYGRNVEVLEILHSSEVPTVFTAFGEFLQSLDKRKEFLNPDRKWIQIFSDLALQAGAKKSMKLLEEPQLIHCVDQPIADQLEAIFIGRGAVENLKFLSPFFDSSAKAVKNLASKAICKRVFIGLLPGRENQSSFPFGTVLGDGLKIEAARVSADQDSRPLHAKWLEADFNDGSSFILTGSINATEKSLCTTDNIEVGLLRLEAAGRKRTLQWRKVRIPESHRPAVFQKPGLGKRIGIHAHITKEGFLAGTIISGQDATGEWTAELIRPDGELVRFEIEVEQDGHFRAPIPNAAHYATATGLQVRVSRREVEGRGWVQNEEILKLPRLPHLGITSLIRLINNEQTDDDDAALLEYLALSAQNHLTTFKLESKYRDRTVTGAVTEDDSTGARIPLERLAPANDSDSGSGDGTQPEAEYAALGEIFGRLRRRLLTTLGTTRNSEQFDDSNEGDEGEGEETDEMAEVQPRRISSGLERFNATMKQLLERSTEQDQLKAVFNMWLEVQLAMLLVRLKDEDGGESFCRHWVRSATIKCRKNSAIATFDRHLITVTATLAANILGRDKELSKENQGRLVELHEELERYCGGPVPREFAFDALVTEPGHVVTEKLRLPEAPASATALERLLQTRTFREELEILTACATEKQKPPQDLLILFTNSGKALAERLRQGQRVEIIDCSPNQTFCPKCYITMTLAVINELHSHRICRCQYCQRFIIDRTY